jgi:hypothetical protein
MSSRTEKGKRISIQAKCVTQVLATSSFDSHGERG